MDARHVHVDGLPLQLGDTGAGVADLHVRLYQAGYLAELPDPRDTYCEATKVAVAEFQSRRRLRTDGICSRATWNALVESNYRLGDRLIYLQKPMTRGDDVEELQRTLGMMGFNAGRVDGIFGPDTQAALADFQRNVALTVDGIAGHETLAALARINSHVGQNTVAAVRENERLRTLSTAVNTCRLVIGDLDGQRALADATARVLRQRGATVAMVEQPDESDQARAANEFGADVYLGLQLADDAICRLSYFAVPNYESMGGKHLAHLLKGNIEQAFGIAVEVQGVRQPTLRETKMPAVVLEVGPPQSLVEARALWASTVAESVEAWLAAPVDPATI